jgi:hypothetical protein
MMDLDRMCGLQAAGRLFFYPPPVLITLPQSIEAVMRPLNFFSKDRL